MATSQRQRNLTQALIPISGGLLALAMLFWDIRLVILFGVLSVITVMQALADDILEAIHQSKGER